MKFVEIFMPNKILVLENETCTLYRQLSSQGQCIIYARFGFEPWTPRKKTLLYIYIYQYL